jgi:hypothetical protein
LEDKILSNPYFILPFPYGYVEAGLQRKLADFFPHTSRSFAMGYGRKHAGKIRRISMQNTASMNTPEYPGTDRFVAGLFDLDMGSLDDIQ